MNDEERKQWLETLKEGDEVYNINYYYGQISSVKKHAIKKITASRRIRLDNDILLDSDGHYYAGGWSTSSVTILPMGEQVSAAIKQLQTKILWKECRDLLEKVDAKVLDYETLGKIKELIENMK
jgi:hypothetical protein